jgi:Mg-chelatase subunit ChlD
MKNHYSEIAFILDRSGSMGSCREAAIEGFNSFLHEQQQTEGLAKLTLVLFDDEYLVPINALPVAEVLPLDNENYVPRGSTALLDAIGRTIEELGRRLAALPEQDRPGQVIVAILTDGLENSSQHYTWKEIARVIKQQTEQYRWTFLFLGANQDAIATAGQISIAASNAASYVADAAGLHASAGSLTRKVRGLRRVSTGTASVEECLDAAAAMSDIIAEEDRKERRQGGGCDNARSTKGSSPLSV